MRILPYLRIAWSVLLIYRVTTHTIPTLRSWKRIETLSLAAFIIIGLLLFFYLLYLQLEALDEIKGNSDARSKGFRIFGLAVHLLFFLNGVIELATSSLISFFALFTLPLLIVDFGKLRVKFKQPSANKEN